MATSPSYYGNYSDKDLPTYQTVADYIADARTLLQDTIPGYRYDDDSLLTALNATMLEAKRLRSDLFVYNLNTHGQVQSFAVVDDTYVDIEPTFRLALVHGICGHAMERDQEDFADSRATAFLNMFTQGLIGRAIGPVVGGGGPGGGG
jgi:hypothetical protein